MLPAHANRAGEASKIAIESDPLRARLDGKRRQPRVGHAWSAHVGLGAETAKYVPVSLARLDGLAVRLGKQVLAKIKSFADGIR